MRPLKSFSLSAIEVRGALEIDANQITLDFLLIDPNQLVQDSLSVGQWKAWDRSDELWKTTCFEAFLGVRGKAAYWELNLSPAKQKWNLYSFDGYRSPQPPRRSSDFELEEITVSAGSLKCRLKSKVPLKKIEASLCAVIRTQEGVNYFALKHAAEKADFHRRESFVLSFP